MVAGNFATTGWSIDLVLTRQYRRARYFALAKGQFWLDFVDEQAVNPTKFVHRTRTAALSGETA